MSSVCAAVAVIAAGCSRDGQPTPASDAGGSGGAPPPADSGAKTSELRLSTDVLTFTTPHSCLTPSPQVVSGMVPPGDGGTLYLRVVSEGPAVASISDVTLTGPDTGEATVYPAMASALGPGTFASTITVSACTTDRSCSGPQLPGSPRTVRVSYEIDAAGVMDDPGRYTLGGWEPAPGGAPFRADVRLAALGDALYAVEMEFYTHVMQTWRSRDLGTSWEKLMDDGLGAQLKDFALASDGTFLYLTGGSDLAGAPTSQVWRFDGTTWTQPSEAAMFPARDRHAMIARATRLYVLGGRSGSTLLDDVWASDDGGATWQLLAIASSSFTPRYDLCAVALGDALYVLGGKLYPGAIGVGDASGEGDVWRSTDGGTWTALPLPANTPFAAAAQTASAQCAAVSGRLYYVGSRANARCWAGTVSSADGVDWQFDAAIGINVFPTPGAAVVAGRMFVLSGGSTSAPYLFRSLP